MRHRKQIITTAGTLACAVGIGFFMQQTQELPMAGYQGAPLKNANASVLNVEDIVLTSASFDDELTAPAPEQAVSQATAQEITTPKDQTLPAAQTLPTAQTSPEEAVLVSLKADDAAAADAMAEEATPLANVCEIAASARPIAAAMVNLTLSAPCLADERVTVHHGGLLFNQVTDAQGTFDITIPAMSQEAVFIVAFSNGEGAVAQATVEELVDFDRVALQWKGDTGFAIHALEFGSDYDGSGHVWSGTPRDMSYAVTGEGGFLSVLGDASVPDSLMAEVYTFPSGISQSEGIVQLSVETEVAANNCALEIEAQSLQVISGKDITSKDLTLSVPDCDASGNFLVLNNLFEDLKVASR